VAVLRSTSAKIAIFFWRRFIVSRFPVKQQVHPQMFIVNQ
jgi:hypothetical protein